ncbi:hypothetical protein D3C80_652910 [compost metagenome]
MFAPTHGVAAAAQAQRHLQLLGVGLEHAQVELHQVPADDGVGVVLGQPLVEGLQQFGAAVAVVEPEVDAAGVAIGRTEHVHLALAAAFQGDGVELAALGGFDVQGHQPEAWAIVRRGLELRVQQQAIGVRRAAEGDRRGDETLHQVAFRRADVGFVQVDAGLAQQLVQAHQLAVLPAIETEYRAMLEVAERQRAQLCIALAAQQGFGAFALLGGNECHRGLVGQADLSRAGIGGQPELDFGPLGRIPPMPGQDETLL